MSQIRLIAGMILVATMSACAMLGLTPEAKYLGMWEGRHGDDVYTFEIMKEGRALAQSGDERFALNWEMDEKGAIELTMPGENERLTGFLKDSSILVLSDPEDGEMVFFTKVEK